MKKLTVDMSSSFTFEPYIIKEFGEFTIDPKYQLTNFPETFSFDLDDIAFATVSGMEMITALKFREQILVDGRIPLNAQCARAIYDDNETLYELKSVWLKQKGGLRSPGQLQTINFFGTMLTNGHKPHTISLEYNDMINNCPPILKPFEATDEGWWRYRDYAIVFTKEFSDKLWRL